MAIKNEICIIEVNSDIIGKTDVPESASVNDRIK